MFWVTFSLVSMDIGTAGFLSLWGADLDPTTVVNILVGSWDLLDHENMYKQPRFQTSLPKILTSCHEFTVNGILYPIHHSPYRDETRCRVGSHVGGFP